MRKKIEDLEPWYQTIKLTSDLSTPGRRECGDHLWLNIKKILPFSLQHKRVLDLGCNAGRYCIGAALCGAEEAVGIEAKERRYSQAQLIKEWFEKENGKLPIRYILGDMRKEINNLSEKFDIVFAISSMYYLKSGREEFLEKLNSLTDNILCGYRPNQEEEYFGKYFISKGFKGTSVFTDILSERFLVLYRR